MKQYLHCLSITLANWAVNSGKSVDPNIQSRTLLQNHNFRDRINGTMARSFNLLIVLIACSVYVSEQQGSPPCHTCELIMNDVKAFFKHDFSNVTADELKLQLEIECDKYHKGDPHADYNCRWHVDIQAAGVLDSLQRGESSYINCEQYFLCGI